MHFYRYSEPQSIQSTHLVLHKKEALIRSFLKGFILILYYNHIFHVKEKKNSSRLCDKMLMGNLAHFYSLRTAQGDF